jgi:hypothetical protein
VFDFPPFPFAQNLTMPQGGLVYISSSGQEPRVILSSIQLIDLSASNVISFSGGINIVLCNNLILNNSVFNNISCAQNGAALLVQQIEEPVIINNCSFFECVSFHDGGAIAFMIDVSFEITSCHFESCVSENGYGGAIYSVSLISGPRSIRDCLFTSNMAYQFVGLDMYDSSGGGELFYSRETVQNCSSTSKAVGSYVLFGVVEVGAFFFFFFFYFIYIFIYLFIYILICENI